MKNFFRLSLCGCLVLVMLCLFACEKKKEGKLEVTERAYHLSQFSDNGWAINAAGKIKNIGEVDVKRVVVTGTCKTCVDVWIPEKWFNYSKNDDLVASEQKEVTDVIGHGKEEASSFDQKDIIGYIAVGDEKPFSFKEFAYFYTQSPDEKPVMPPEDELEIVIESFLTADK